MSISPLYVGETHPHIDVTWATDTGGKVDLTGATVQLFFRNKATGVVTEGAGVMSVSDPPNGLLSYALNAADVAVAGNFQIQFKATFGDGTVLDSDPQQLQILAPLVVA